MAKSLKIKKMTLSDQVCQVIKEKIKTEEWKVDSKIPSENELAETFGVNRLTIRNALQKLGALGIVETKAGEGTFVRKFDFSEYIREVSGLVMSPEMLNGVMEFRKCIEMECIKLAIERAGEDDIAELEKVLKHYEQVAMEPGNDFDTHIDNIIEADLNFHHQLCKISGNSLFPLAFTAVREPMYQYIKAVLVKRYTSYAAGDEKDKVSSAATQNHKVILEAIRKRDLAASAQAFLNVIDYKNLK